MKTKIVCMGYIIQDSKVLLVKHKKTNRYMSCGGHLKENENFTECLKREIKEELNLDINIINSSSNEIKEEIPFVINNKKNENKNLIIIEYLCKTNNFKEIKLNKNELTEFKLFSKEEVEIYNFNPSLKEILEKIFIFIETHNNLI